MGKQERIKQISVVLIEEHAVYRESIGQALKELEYYRCDGSFSNIEDAFDAFNEGLDPDIVLLDLGLPGMSGLEGIAPSTLP